nr:MAG TPA: hypothetical protein [Bacteriophage sp.]DAJ19475.1 MAG TPA: hypothetical protein [Podoviridae sp. ctgHy19]
MSRLASLRASGSLRNSNSLWKSVPKYRGLSGALFSSRLT